MGHALNASVQDVLIRMHRMQGVRTKWIFGTDHAGIATQTQVESQLEREGLQQGADRPRGVRAARVGMARAVRPHDRDQFQRLGASCDYQDERFTLDEDYVRAVVYVFKALYDRGLIYRDNYIVNWDPGTRSAISDLEVEDREVTDTLYYIDYPFAEARARSPSPPCGRRRCSRTPRWR